MDTITIDITALPEDAVGSGLLVGLLSPGHGLDGAAARAGTIGREIFTNPGRRYARRYVSG